MRGSFYDLSEIYKMISLSSKSITYDINLFKNAYNLILRSVRNQGIGLVQGPPGAGKTTLLSSVYHERLRVGDIDPDEIFIIIAPTNDLVADIAKKVFQSYHALDMISDVPKEVRVYGSRVGIKNDVELKSITGPINQDVRIVITTPYQLPYFKGEEKSIFHILVDEAGASPVHKPFIPSINILRSLEEGKELDFGSFSLVGDPMQAISFGDLSPSDKNRILIMTNVIKGLLGIHSLEELSSFHSLYNLLKEAHKVLKGRYFETLRITHRLPWPSEEPISHGFYFDDLKSMSTLNISYLPECGKKILQKWLKYNSFHGVEGLLNRVARSIEEAISDNKPIIYVETYLEGQTYGGNLPYIDLNFDVNRAFYAIVYASSLRVITGLGVTIISPYVDQTIQTKIAMFRRIINRMKDFIPRECMEHFKELIRGIRFSTVHKFLGKEDDIVIAILGKENRIRSNSGVGETIYFRQPEVLNVQFSRHRKLLVIVGNLPRMYKYSKDAIENDVYYPIKLLLEKFQEMSNLDFKFKPLKSDVVLESDYIVFDQHRIN